MAASWGSIAQRAWALETARRRVIRRGVGAWRDSTGENVARGLPRAWRKSLSCARGGEKAIGICLRLVAARAPMAAALRLYVASNMHRGGARARPSHEEYWA